MLNGKDVLGTKGLTTSNFKAGKLTGPEIIFSTVGPSSDDFRKLTQLATNSQHICKKGEENYFKNIAFPVHSVESNEVNIIKGANVVTDAK